MSLLTEKPLVVSPQLAATLGLEEAVLLQLLYEFTRYRPLERDPWFSLDSQLLESLAPFWNARDIQRIGNSLRDKGLLQIHSPPYEASGVLTFTFHELPMGTATRAAVKNAAPERAVPEKKGANQIAPNWQPDDDTLRQLAQYNIPRDFTLAQTPEFVAYWQERGEPRHSWNAKFIKHILRLWREEQTVVAQRCREVAMHPDWQPATEAFNILKHHAEINTNFIEDAIPEFILYWRERGTRSSNWNSQFIQHVKRQWVKFTATLEHQSDPHIIPTDWQPSEDLYEVLRLANIPRDFAEREIPPFVLFWRETGRAHNSWNTKFLQHVKRQWAYNRSQPAETQHGNQQATHQSISTRATSLVDDLTDRSWAN